MLDNLVEDEAITEDFANKLLAWKHSGFSVDNKVRVGANDPERRRWLRKTGRIIVRSRLPIILFPTLPELFPVLAGRAVVLGCQ